MKTAEDFAALYYREFWESRGQTPLFELFRAYGEEVKEQCAMLHENINPASDKERLHNIPGANAMGAVIEYRDKIRALKLP